jgi:NADPH-dependent 2,4-dienoyl-CoA reductase/sulfur reductase-like enzyme
MDLAIIGGGPAGLSAAIRAREEGIRDVRVIERHHALGGILNQCIHHGFGLHIFKEELTGPEYAQRLIDRAYGLDVRFELGSMVLDITKNREITYASPAGLVRTQAKAVILAMGCRERSRGALGIPGSRPAGVYSAGTAQALVNMKGYMPGKRVVILGSGDIGLIMARRMTLEGAKVVGVYEIMPHSSGLKRNIAQCLNDYGIPLFLSHTVTRTVGHKRLEGVYVAKADGGLRPLYDTESYIPCDTLLLSVGLIPENELSKKAGVTLSAVTNGAVVNDKLETSIPGIYACGNVLHVHDLADNVTLEAYEAAVGAADFIKGKSAASNVRIPVNPGKGVRYTVPSVLTSERGEFELLFRAAQAHSPAYVKVYAGGELIKSTKKRIVTPGEMERVKFALNGNVTAVTINVEN